MLVTATVFSAGKTGQPKWLSLQDAEKTAQKEHKPILIVFWHPGCGWCVRFEKQTLNNPIIADILNKHFAPVKVNTRSNSTEVWQSNRITERNFAARFGIRGTPTTAFFDDSLKFLTKLPGYVPAENFESILKYIYGKWYENLTFQEFMESEKKLGGDR